MPDLTIGDILKSEADPNNRIAIPAPVGTKTGQPVNYAARDQYLFALTDEVNGEVLVQPHNCVMNLAPIMQTDIDAVFTDDLDSVSLTTAELITQGDAHGIKYIGTPK
jgi:hypothetical protein